MANICSGNLQVSTSMGWSVMLVIFYIAIDSMTGGGLKPSATNKYKGVQFIGIALALIPKRLKGCHRKTILLNHYSNNL
ncbi:MAG: hypothetical protein ACE5GU_12420 [Candidatus Scalinduaceae bacterium]